MTEAVQTIEDHSVSSIALATVRSATRNFSTRNVVGEGTFGIVYEVSCKSHNLLQDMLDRRYLSPSLLSDDVQFASLMTRFPASF